MGIPRRRSILDPTDFSNICIIALRFIPLSYGMIRHWSECNSVVLSSSSIDLYSLKIRTCHYVTEITDCIKG